MTTLRTIQDGISIVNLRLEPGESAVVEFQPDGNNAHSGSPILGFLISTLNLPNGGMALTINFPENDVYWRKPQSTMSELHRGKAVTLVLLSDNQRPEEMTLVLAEGEMLELERFSSNNMMSNLFHKGG